jgi:hypothetical protein
VVIHFCILNESNRTARDSPEIFFEEVLREAILKGTWRWVLGRIDELIESECAK